MQIFDPSKKYKIGCNSQKSKNKILHCIMADPRKDKLNIDGSKDINSINSIQTESRPKDPVFEDTILLWNFLNSSSVEDKMKMNEHYLAAIDGKIRAFRTLEEACIHEPANSSHYVCNYYTYDPQDSIIPQQNQLNHQQQQKF